MSTKQFKKIAVLALSFLSLPAFAGSFEDAVKEYGLREKAASLTPHFSQDPAGAALKRVAILHILRSGEGPGAAQLALDLEFLKRNPAESLRALGFSLDRLPSKNQTERQVLINLVNELEAEKQDRKALLEREVLRTKVEDNSDAQKLAANALIATQELISLQGNGRAVAGVVRRSLELRQTQRDSLEMIISHFETFDRESADSFRRDFKVPRAPAPQ